MTHTMRLVLGFFILSLLSCSKNTLPVNAQYAPLNESKLGLSIIDSIHNQPWHYFYGKYTTTYKEDAKGFSFKTSLKISKDSALNAIVSLANIPFFNALATRDSLIYMNKKDRCYGRKSISYFETLLGLKLSLTNIEELFLGLPLGYTNQNNNARIDANKDTIRFTGVIDNQHPLAYVYNLNAKTNRITWQRIESTQDSTVASIYYEAWNLIDKFHIPTQIKIAIEKPQQNILVYFSYDKMELNLPIDIYLQIPNDYAPCN